MSGWNFKAKAFKLLLSVLVTLSSWAKSTSPYSHNWVVSIFIPMKYEMKSITRYVTKTTLSLKRNGLTHYKNRTISQIEPVCGFNNQWHSLRQCDAALALSHTSCWTLVSSFEKCVQTLRGKKKFTSRNTLTWPVLLASFLDTSCFGSTQRSFALLRAENNIAVSEYGCAQW